MWPNAPQIASSVANETCLVLVNTIVLMVVSGTPEREREKRGGIAPTWERGIVNDDRNCTLSMIEIVHGDREP